MNRMAAKLRFDESRLILHRRLEQLTQMTGSTYFWPSIDDGDDLHELVSLIDEAVTEYIKTREAYNESMEDSPHD